MTEEGRAAEKTPFSRYVALGDSSTEGLDDPNPSGGYRGWSERLASHIVAASGPIEYANLAVRGLTTRQVLEGQVAPALALAPDLVTLFVGTNDVTAPKFDEDAFASDLQAAQAQLRAAGATVLGFTLPDLAAVMPLARFVRGRVLRMNEQIREVSASTGSLVVDFADVPLTSDARLWSEDRIHANSLGHERMASALAHKLGLGGHGNWMEPLPRRVARRPLGKAADEARWVGRYFVPWVWRSVTGRTSGDGLSAKYPALVEWSR